MIPGPDGTRFDLYALERVLAFSDGVFAVAITLLVIDLRPPDISHGASDVALLSALAAMGEKFLIYVISFFVVGALWAGHTRKFRYIVAVDGPLMWLNLAFLMAICVVPFATALNSTFGNLTAGLTYLGTLTVASALGAAVSVYGLSHSTLVSSDLRPGRRRDLILSPVLNTFVFVLAMAVSLWSLNAGRSLLLILPASAYAGSRKHG